MKKPALLWKVECWGLTTILAFAVFYLVSDTFSLDDNGFQGAPYRNYYIETGTPYSYYGNYFLPQLIRCFGVYAVVAMVHLMLLPRLMLGKSIIRNLMLILLIAAALGLLLGLTAQRLFAFRYSGQDAHEINKIIFSTAYQQSAILLLIIAVVNAIEYGGLYLFRISASIEARYHKLRKEAIVAAGIWLAGLLFCAFAKVQQEIVIGWFVSIPSGIVVYLFSFNRLLPVAMASDHNRIGRYVASTLPVLGILALIVYLLSALIVGWNKAGYVIFNTFFQLLVTMPLSWILYERHIKEQQQLRRLERALGESTASLDLLRSQINPHFLFNALNTLYGTAILERAPRTGEGIQQLGDMMRFMLHENLRDTIPLSREIEYIRNYIELQRLRIASSSNVRLDVQLPEWGSKQEIAPMLLIPFIENAFKHGISFREQSDISIALDLNGSRLVFCVTNSKHLRVANDPEGSNNGIGLENVRQRLRICYPERHKLLIADGEKEFSVRLEIQLAASQTYIPA